MKITTTTKRGRLTYRVAWMDAGRERRRFFATQREADQFAATLKRHASPDYIRWLRLSPDERLDALSAIELARAGRHTLLAAVTHYRDSGAAVIPCTIDQAWRDFLVDKQHTQRVRASTLGNLRTKLQPWLSSLDVEMVSDITADHLRQWLAAHQWSALTTNAWIIHAGTFLTWCRARHYCSRVVSNDVTRSIIEETDVIAFTPTQARQLMRACVDHDMGMAAYFALGLYAGLRPAETQRIRWPDIDLDNATLMVRASSAKTRRTRVVHLQPIAVAWLRAARSQPLPVAPNWNKRFDLVREWSGVTWHNDILRHSYCTHIIPLIGLREAAMEAGNSEQVLLKHYRRPVPRPVAEDYFRL